MSNSIRRSILLLSILVLFSCEEVPKENEAAKLEIATPKPPLKEKSIVEQVFLPDYDTLVWTDVADLDSNIIMDIKYATTDNFVKEKMYECGRCFLRPDVADAVLNVHKKLNKIGKGLKMYDCYRPRPFQQKLWDKVPNPSYVTPPEKGSMHNRGSAVDLTLVDAEGRELDMGTGFDFFGKRAHSDNEDLPAEILANRKLLQSTMMEFGFKPIRTEWWHYYYAKNAPTRYELSDMLWECDH